MQNIKTCVIVGAGMVAKTHVLACAASPEKIRLKGLVDGGSGRARALAAEASKHAGYEVAVYSSVEEAARDADVDFAIIATPPNARIDIVGQLAKAGKHILMEKPIARNTQEAEGLVALCRDAGVTLGIIFQHRMRAASQKARELVDDGTLGALGLCEISVPWWRAQSYYDEPGRGTLARDGGGVLISQAIHTIDLALSLAGPVSRVQAMAATTRFHRMETEDYVAAGLRFTNGAVGSLVASTASFPGTPESIVLHLTMPACGSPRASCMSTGAMAGRRPSAARPPARVAAPTPWLSRMNCIRASSRISQMPSPQGARRSSPVKRLFCLTD